MTSQTRSVEWMLAICTLIWGFGLLWPGDSFALPQLAAFAIIASEATWGLISIVLGCVRLVALIINGSWCRTPLIRALCAVIGIGWWLVLAYLYRLGYSGRPVGPAMNFIYVFVGFEVYSVYRGAKDSWRTGALRRWRSPKPS